MASFLRGLVLVLAFSVSTSLQNLKFVDCSVKSRALRLTTCFATVATTDEDTGRINKWYPNRIQEDVDYRAVVKSVYLRHVVVERMETAELVLERYVQDTTSEDPFGKLATLVSACAESKDEDGKIGWLDISLADGPEASWPSPLLPKDVFEELLELAPKAGDIHILESKGTDQIHVVRVEELMLKHSAETELDPDKITRVGSYSGRNLVLSRKKLKGKGVMPRFPDIFDNVEEKSYHIQTNGCQMNVADSERLAGILENDLKLTRAEKAEKADVVLFNTCSIRDHAEQKLYDLLGPYCARKRNGEEIALIVTGCVAQQEGEALLSRVPEVDCVLGPQYVTSLRNVLEQIEWGNQLVVTAPMLHQDGSGVSKPIRDHPTRAWVNVVHGCNEHCTYCVVPATRGMEQSRSMESIIAECKELVDDGYLDITLLGQNIDAYGRDMTPKRSFAALLTYLDSNLPSNVRIRYTTSHPRYMSKAVVDAIAQLGTVCEAFHVPFQAGDDEVLKRMRRGYTFDSYMKIIDRIRTKSPDAGIFADVIVGFPGETEEAFQRTLDLMELVKFDNLNSFAYSPRPNTEAASFPDQVPEDVKKERLHRVQDLATRHGLERSQRYLNRIVEVLVEDKNPRNTGQVMGRTRQGRQVYFDGDIQALQGEYVQVKITEAGTWSLIGEAC